MALLNPKKKVSGSQKISNMTVDQAKAKILAVRNAKSGSLGGQQLSAQGQANVNAMFAPQTSKSVSANSKAVSSVLGRGLGTNIGTPKTAWGGFGGGTGGSFGSTTTPKLEFSVLPGAKPGPVSLGYSGMPASQMGGSGGTNAVMTAEQARREKSTRWLETASQFVAGGVPAAGTRVGVALGTGLAKNAGNWTKLLTKAKSLGDDTFNSVRNLFKRGGDDAFKAADDLVRGVPKSPVGRIAGPVASTVIRTVARHPVISGLGALAVGSALVGSGDSPTGSAGTVRNAVPSTGADTNTNETTDASQRTASPQSFSTFDQQVSSMSAPSGGSSFVGGGSVGGGFGGGVGGSTGGNALRGEGTSEERAQAQAKAMQLARSQVDQAGVGAAPIGDQVDLASLQALRDKTRSMLDQYGASASTMPEFKANIQALIASGVENLKKIQPSPPEPVVETPEQEQFANQNDARAFMDDVRKQLGMTKLESQRIDVMQQLQVVQETYQGVIDQIKENPNLPKGLAARRLTEVFEDQKFASNQLLAQLEIIDQQLEDGNNELDRQFGIFKYEQDQNEKAQARRADQLGFMIDSGAIAGMSDKEIRQWASATGIPEEAIRQMKTNSLNPSKEWSISYETNPNTGEKFAIYTDKNDPTGEPQVVSLGAFGVKNTSGGEATGGDIDTYARLLMSDPEWIAGRPPAVLGTIPSGMRAKALARADEMANAPYDTNELEGIISSMQGTFPTLESMLEAIETDPRFTNKAEAGHVAAGMFGVKPEDFAEKTGGITGFFSNLFR